MSYVVTLNCGCDVYVACHPRSGLAHTRIVERRAPGCAIRTHAIGARLPLWELLPYAAQTTAPVRVTARRQNLQNL